MRRIRPLIAAALFLLFNIQPILSFDFTEGLIARDLESEQGEKVVIRLPGDSRIGVERFDGAIGSPVISLRGWRQLVFEMSKASPDGVSGTGVREMGSVAA